MLALHMLLFTKSGCAGEHRDFSRSAGEAGLGGCGALCCPHAASLSPSHVSCLKFAACFKEQLRAGFSRLPFQRLVLALGGFNQSRLRSNLANSAVMYARARNNCNVGNERRQKTWRVPALTWVAHIWSLTKPRSVPCKGKIKGCMATWRARHGMCVMGSGCASTWRCCRMALPSLILCFAPALLKHLSQHHVQTEAQSSSSSHFCKRYPCSFHLNVDVVITERRIPVFRDLRPQ